MNVLVMGGTSFVGGALGKYLVARGYTVDLFTRGLREPSFSGYNAHLKGDRKNKQDLASCLSDKQYDVVFDITAFTAEDVQTLTEVINHDTLKQYVFLSSGAVYSSNHVNLGETAPRGENHHWGEYGLHKKEAEDYLIEAYETHQLPITIFRPTYIYGEGNVLYREGYFFDRIQMGLSIPIPSGQVAVQFIHIDDVVRVLESAIHLKETIGQAYNLTYSELISWEAFVETAMTIVGQRVNMVHITDNFLKALSTGVTTRHYFPFRNINYQLDDQKLKSCGLYHPQIALYHGLKQTYEWYKKEVHNLSDSKMDLVEYVLEKVE